MFQGRDNGPQCEGLDRRMKVVGRRAEPFQWFPQSAPSHAANPETRRGFLAHMRRGVGGGGGDGAVLFFFYTRALTHMHIRSLKIPSRRARFMGVVIHPPSTILRQCHLQRLMSPSALSNMAVSGIEGWLGGKGKRGMDGGREGGWRKSHHLRSLLRRLLMLSILLFNHSLKVTRYATPPLSVALYPSHPPANPTMPPPLHLCHFPPGGKKNFKSESE